MESNDKKSNSCPACHRVATPGEPICKHCGWDSERIRRHCPGCAETLELIPPSGTVTKILNGLMIGGTVAGGIIFGFLGAMAWGLGMLAIGRLYCWRSLGYRCASCGWQAADNELMTREIEEGNSKRITALMSGVASLCGALLFAGAWLVFVVGTAVVDAGNIETDISALAAKGEAAIPELAAALREESTRSDARVALERLGAPAVPALIEILQEEDEELRWHCRQALKQIGQPSVMPAAALLTHDNSQTRSEAADILNSLAGEADEAVPMIAAALQDSNTKVRLNCASALRKMGGRAVDARDELIDALKDSDAEVREIVALALGSLTEEGTPAVEALELSLQDPVPAVRGAAAAALGYIGRSAASSIPALQELQKDSNEKVRWEAQRAVKSIER